jgi:hypothetical protein
MNHRKPRLTPRVAPVSPHYLERMRQLDEKRRAAGLTHEQLEERADIARGSWSKLLHPDNSSGRIASAKTMNKVLNVLGHA